MNWRDLQKTRSDARILYEGHEEARCPTCDNVVEIPKGVSLKRIRCKECGQCMADDPKDREVEV